MGRGTDGAGASLYAASEPVLRIRIWIGSGFNHVLGSGVGIRIRIQGQES